jgi:2-polyprenyl-3-methyl-5-hydroxy-6-metoxy-1,4-benzoquinol methylase
MQETEDLDKYVDAYEDSFPYSRDNHGVLTAYAAELVKSCDKLPGHLDICSLGIGYEIVSRSIADVLGPRISSYTAIEGSRLLIERYQKQADFDFPFELTHAYFENYETHKRFDVIEMGFVLEHVIDPAAIVRRFAPLLKPDGIIVAAVPNALSMHRVLGQRAGLLNDVYALNEWDHKLGHRRYFDARLFRDLFTTSGCEVTRETGLMLKPFSTAQIEALGLPENVWNVLCHSGDLAPVYAYSLFIEARAGR